MPKIWRFLRCPDCKFNGWTDYPDSVLCSICLIQRQRSVELGLHESRYADEQPTEPGDPPPAVGNARRFVALVCSMRQAQRAYFRQKRTSDLMLSKDLERDVDRMLAPPGPTLFDKGAPDATKP
jgi:hypothetical protein